MQEGYWMIRTYQAGPMGEKTKYFVPGTRPSGRIRVRDKREINKQEQNEYAAQKALARILNANFVAGDLLLGLDISDAGMDKILSQGLRKGLPVYSSDPEEAKNARWDAASNEIPNLLNRVRRELKKEGKELKAVSITSDMDGETKEENRLHFHLVVNAGTEQAFIAAWEKKGFGTVDWEYLHENQKDRTPIAEYFLRQVRHIPNANKYHTTRNLIRPVPKDRIALTGAELTPPKGAKLVFRQEFKPGRPQYIRYELPEAGLTKVPVKPPPQSPSTSQSPKSTGT